MSYIPDYRNDIDKLNGYDREYMEGYIQGIEDAKSSLSDALENLDTENDELVEEFEALCECSEIETMCCLAEKVEYEDIEFKDANGPLYFNTKGASR